MTQDDGNNKDVMMPFTVAERLFGAVVRVVRGQLIGVGICSVLYGVCFYLFSIPHGLWLGLASGFGKLVPYGDVVMALIGGGVSTYTAEDIDVVWAIFGVLVTVVVVGLIDFFVITPRVMGSVLGVSTWKMIVFVLIFTFLFGAIGLLIAMPVLAILIELKQIYQERMQKISSEE